MDYQGYRLMYVHDGIAIWHSGELIDIADNMSAAKVTIDDWMNAR